MLVLLTPTHNRPKSFSFLEKYVAAQTIAYDHWLVACDGDLTDYRFSMGQTVIISSGVHDELHSIPRNYLLLADQAEALGADKILFVEDDDWIAPKFLENYSRWLDKADLVGLARNRYYHVGKRFGVFWANDEHSSLASTGITSRLLPLLRDGCLADQSYLDMWLWGRWKGTKEIHPENWLHVGIKGFESMGYGFGHFMNGCNDPEGEKLREWLGEDAKNYQ